MKPVEILRGARDLLADPSRWTKDTFARNAQGEPADEHAEEAVCFCLLGAVRRVGGGAVEDESQINARWLLREHLPEETGNPAAFNDDPGTTHADVLALLDRAIAAAEA